MSKGKEHGKYEFGSKASIAATENGGIIVGASSFSKNVYDGHTLVPVFEQAEKLLGTRPEAGIRDRGRRRRSMVDGTPAVVPKPPSQRAAAYGKRKARKRFGRGAAVEPVIGHLKSDFGPRRNYLEGVAVDSMNPALSAAAFNFKKPPRRLIYFFSFFIVSQQERNGYFFRRL